MVNMLDLALAELATLPKAAQEQIGRELLAYVENLSRLRVEIEKAAHELDTGLGREPNIEGFLAATRRQRHAKP